MIDTRAIIDPGAKLAEDVSVGPWSIVGPDVEIGVRRPCVDRHIHTGIAKNHLHPPPVRFGGNSDR